jgi:hypothetical protein
VPQEYAIRNAVRNEEFRFGSTTSRTVDCRVDQFVGEAISPCDEVWNQFCQADATMPFLARGDVVAIFLERVRILPLRRHKAMTRCSFH